MNTKENNLKIQLHAIIAHEPNTIRCEVAHHALEHESIALFFTDLLHYGCQSGMVSSLIYYTDTHTFFDTHYDEIEILRIEIEESLGSSLAPTGDLKNWFAWFAFEETARILADELNIPW